MQIRHSRAELAPAKAWRGNPVNAFRLSRAELAPAKPWGGNPVNGWSSPPIRSTMCIAAMYLATLLVVPKPTIGSGSIGFSRQDPIRFERAFPAMGVQFRVVAYAQSERGFDAALAAVERRVKLLENILSDYDPHSEVNTLCHSAPHREPVKISADLWRVCKASADLARRTDGAFDPTIGPITKIWRMARKRNRLPESAEIEAAMKAVGWSKVVLSNHQPLIQLTVPEMHLDFGGIGKGYAADQAMELLAEHGIQQALVDAGGDIRVSAAPPDQPGWIIAIESSAKNLNAITDDVEAKKPASNIVIANAAIAASGATRQRLVKNGQSHSHLIDPRTGMAVTRPGNVTVVAKDATTADAMASALSVLGPEKGLKLLRSFSGAQAAFDECSPANDQVHNRCSPGFRGYLAAPAADSVANPTAGLGD